MTYFFFVVLISLYFANVKSLLYSRTMISKAKRSWISVSSKINTNDLTQNTFKGNSTPFNSFLAKITSSMTIVTTLSPIVSFASAEDVMQLYQTGYISRSPDWLTWVVMLWGAYLMQYRIFKFLSHQ